MGSFSKKELSENALRRILLELISDRLIERLDSGQYRVTNTISGMFGDFTGIQNEIMPALSGLVGLQQGLIDDQETKKAIYKAVSAHSYQLTMAELIVKIVEDSLCSTEEARTIIAQEIGRGRLLMNQDEKIGFGPNAAIGD